MRKEKRFDKLFLRENSKLNRRTVRHPMKNEFRCIFPEKAKTFDEIEFRFCFFVQIDSNYYFELFSHCRKPLKQKLFFFNERRDEIQTFLLLTTDLTEESFL